MCYTLAMKRKALYLPEEIHRRLQLIAERNDRTMVLQVKNWVDIFAVKEKKKSEEIIEELYDEGNTPND